MPGFDGTGPQGRGPMTGKAMGYCILRESDDIRMPVTGLAGIDATPIVEMPRVVGRGFGLRRRHGRRYLNFSKSDFINRR